MAMSRLQRRQRGAHLGEAILNPRDALRRAVRGEAPWGSLLGMTITGLLSSSWVLEVASAPHSQPSFVSFGNGVGWALLAALGLACFVGVVHALHPPGGGPAPTPQGSAMMVLTAGVGPSLLSSGLGVLALTAHAFSPSQAFPYALVALWAVGAAWGLILVGLGMAEARGASTVAGLLSALGAVVAMLVVSGMLVLIYLYPPWGDAWRGLE